MSGVLSNVLQGKTPKHLRKWGPPWGGSWVPWASRGDPETLSREDAENVAPVGAAATAAAAATVASAAGTPPVITGAPEDVRGGDGGSVEGQEGGEGVNGQKAGGATLKEGRWLPTELARFVTHLEESIHKDGRSERAGARAGAAANADSCVVRSKALKD